MSFTSEIKKELCMTESNKCCLEAELCSVICFGAHIRNNCLILRTENKDFAQRIVMLTKAVFGRPAIIIHKTTPGLLEVQIADENTLTTVLEAFNLIRNARSLKNFVSFTLPMSMYENLCCTQAILRGAFLTSGSCAEPEKRYHLEISTNHFMLGKQLQKILQDMEIPAKTINRRSNTVIYLKGAEFIHDFLGYTGAMKAVLKLADVRVIKEFKNKINRANNFDCANFSKSVDAGNQQADAIRKIRDTVGFSMLDDTLKEIANLRLEHPDASLKELGTMLSEPLSKSGINHRLKRLMEIAENLPRRS